MARVVAGFAGVVFYLSRFWGLLNSERLPPHPVVISPAQCKKEMPLSRGSLDLILFESLKSFYSSLLKVPVLGGVSHYMVGVFKAPLNRRNEERIILLEDALIGLRADLDALNRCGAAKDN